MKAKHALAGALSLALVTLAASAQAQSALEFAIADAASLQKSQKTVCRAVSPNVTRCAKSAPTLMR